MRRGQRISHCHSHRGDLVGLHTTMHGDDVGERTAVEVLASPGTAGPPPTARRCTRSRREGESTVARSCVPRAGTLATPWVLDVPPQHLDSDETIEGFLPCQVHDGRTAPTQSAQDGVPRQDRRSTSGRHRARSAMRTEHGCRRHLGPTLRTARRRLVDTFRHVPSYPSPTGHERRPALVRESASQPAAVRTRRTGGCAAVTRRARLRRRPVRGR